MNRLLRSWRVLLLAWAVLLAPQLSLVHTLSHVASQAANASHGQSVDKRHQASDSVCEICLAFAQLGSALPSHHEWAAQAEVFAAPEPVPARTLSTRTTAHYLARAPPSALI